MGAAGLFSGGGLLGGNGLRVRALRVLVVCSVVVGVVGGCAGGGGSGEGAARASGTARSAGESGTAAPEGSPAAVPSASGATPVVSEGKGCNGTPVFLGEGFPEVRGTAQGAELWGLLFVGQPPLSRKKEIKIVWRMTGEGPLRVRATLPDGSTAKLAWGPEQHGGSNWRRPGQEWGTGFVFPKPGCWKVELTRTSGSGHAWLLVK